MINLLISNPLVFFYYAAALLVAITVHEFAHALTADRLGDPTARLAGRLSLNPLVHLDSIGLLFLLFFGFGWGKPVPFDNFNLQNPRRDAAIISFAGPVSNFLLAVIFSIILRLSLQPILIPFISLNVIIGIFNLLPIHPLDGFKIVAGFLSEEQAAQWNELARYGIIFFLLLILPFAGSSTMLDLFIRPITGFFINLLIPSSIGGNII